MKIIVIGAGELGRCLASALSEEDHDVIIVDSDADEIARVTDKFDAMTIEGSCSSVEILKQTGSKTLVTGCAAGVIPSDGSVTSIGECAFSGCAALPSVTIPEGVVDVGADAFWDCAKLKSVVIPGSVTSIGQNAFADCSALTEIDYRGTKETWDKIGKGDAWDENTGNYRILCVDRVLPKE